MEFVLNKKIYPKDCITLDGKMDEAVWAEAQEFTDFRGLETHGSVMPKWQTYFKILTCEDRLYIGIRCDEDNMPYLIGHREKDTTYCGDHVEVFFSPSGDHGEFYQFFVTAANKRDNYYYEEGGGIKPDPFHPIWNSAVYDGEDYWSCEIEIPYTAFYMTRNHNWSDKWLFNITRVRNLEGIGYSQGGNILVSWSQMLLDFFEPQNFNKISGFPKRVIEDDIYISSAAAEMTVKNADNYEGVMTVRTTNAVAGDFEFSSAYTAPVKVSLQPGENVIEVPCAFEKEIRYPVKLLLTRLSDGVEIGRIYPVLVSYEPIKIQMTLPEYRNNFYPGQDYSKVMGKATAAKPITLKLEGPGIETQIITPNAEGNFCFDTANFEEGDAFLTATIDGAEVVKKIRRLAPSGNRMSWISGGNLVVDGKPVIRRGLYSHGWRGGELFRRKFASEPQYLTRDVHENRGSMRIDVLMPGCDSAGGEAQQDRMPSNAMLAKIDALIEANRGTDFTHYYIADEPECRNVSNIYLKKMYEYIADKDPYHVILIASRGADRYVECADWFETHPYINPVIKDDGTRIYARPVNTVGRYIDDIVKLNRSDKCIGFLPTSFSYKFITLAGDYPTFDEMLAHTWAATVRGSKTLYPFFYTDLADRASVYEGTRFIFSSHEALEDLILFGKRTTLINTPEVEAVRFDIEGESMFVLLNKVETPQSVTVPGIEGTWCNFRRASDITTNTFDLIPFEVIIGTTKDRSGDLPTYQQMKAISENHDYKRTHCKSLLYERTGDIGIKASCGSRSFYKLFDGVLDDLGFEDFNKHPRFIELNLSKVAPTFRTVSVTGWHIDGMTVTLKKGDAVLEPAVVEHTAEEFKQAFTFAEAVTPDVLRLDFPNPETLEVFEIDVFA